MILCFSLLRPLLLLVCAAACAHWWLFLWFGHQSAPWWVSAGDRPRSLHRDPGPHDFCHLLCLQRLLCGVCGHQERTSEEGKSWACSLVACCIKTPSLLALSLIHRGSTGLWHAEIVKWSFSSDGSLSQEKGLLIFYACSQRVSER